MSKFFDSLGTIGSYFRIGISSTSVRLKPVSGALQIRNGTDTADADLKANSLTLTTPLSIAQGGTGATTASAARSSLGISGAYDYSQSTVPSSPTNGQTWKELDSNGNPIEVWMYDSTNARWVSQMIYNDSVSGLLITDSTTLRIPFGFSSGNTTGALLTRCEAVLSLLSGQTAHSSSLYYTIAFQKYNQGAVSALTGVSDLDTKALSSTGNNVYAFTSALQTQSVFTTQTPAQSATDGSGSAGDYEMGMRFQSSVSGTINAIRFYKPSGETGTHVGHVWASNGSELTNVTFTNETASGWQEQALATPLSISANTVYTVSVNTNLYYVFTSQGLVSSITNTPLSTIADGTNGVINNTPGQFPSSPAYQNGNYFRDVVFQASTATASPGIYVPIGASGASSWATTLTKVSTPGNLDYSICFSSRRVR